MNNLIEEYEDELEDGPILSAACKRTVARSTIDILEAVGEDPTREGLRRTPLRIAEMYDELLAGYEIDPEKLLNGALFDVEYDQMVMVNDIEFYSLCEHHMLPIVGKAHVAYLPGKYVVGLSKIPRIVDAFARRLQIQERMTQQIAALIERLIEPQGVAVVIDAAHFCVRMRGIESRQARMRTSELRGVFRTNAKTRTEFMNHVNQL